MTDPISSIASYLSADVRALGTLSRNIANINTPGYRSVGDASAFGGALRGDGVDRKDGALIRTGRPMDLALQGQGFFQVVDGGRVLLTRNGQFSVGADGRVTDALGRALLGEGGPLTLGEGSVLVGEDGSVRLGGDAVDRIALADVPADMPLTVLGDGIYAAPEGGAVTAAAAKVVQGSLEGSNVDPAHEMVRLMELTRHAGSVQRAIATYHSSLIAGIDGIGKES